MSQLSSRLGQFRPSPTTEMGALVRRLRAEGRDIIGMVNGEPDFSTPDNIKDAGIRAIATNNTRYTDSNGTAELRTALSAKFKRENGLDYAPDQIVVSSGNKPLLHAALLAMIDPGDEVIIPAPHWPSHPDIVQMAGGVPVSVPCPIEAGFRLSPEALEAAITPRTRALVLNSPNNPTGAAYDRHELQALIAVLKRHPDIWILTDEIYEHIRFDRRDMPSLAALDEEIAARTVTANGASKGYVMTGWRIGFAGGPRPIMEAISSIVGQLIGSPSAISQAAMIEALAGDQGFLQRNASIFQERRDIAVEALGQMPGLRCHVPEGAFYLFVDCAGVIGCTQPDGHVIQTDDDFVRGCVKHAGVAFVPGSAFGLSPYFRLAYSLETGQLRVAMERLRRYCNMIH